MKQLEDNARRVRALVEGVGEGQARWKPEAGCWSILEVMCHLLDEERYDFRVRLEITLQRADEPWPPIDPVGWVTARNYNQQDLRVIQQGFLEERAASLVWLEGLAWAAWETAYEAPWGSIRAGDLLASWVAHDLLHMRQLVELHWSYNEEQVESYSTRYAGEW
jgi:hypothetical protein